MPTLHQTATTAWFAMQANRYSPDTLRSRLGIDHVDLADQATAEAVLDLAVDLDGTWGDSEHAERAARQSGYHPIGCYDDEWEYVDGSDPHTPVGEASDLATRRWEVLRRMADGMAASNALAGFSDVISERKLQRMRQTGRMTDETRDDGLLPYQPDPAWHALCDEALAEPGDPLRPVEVALREGVMVPSDLPAGHPIGEAIRVQRRAAANSRRQELKRSRLQAEQLPLSLAV